MFRSLALLTLVAATLPATAQIQKCAGGATLTYSDGNCPAPAKSAPPVANAALRVDAHGQAVDAPLELIETGIPVIVQMPGRFAWLDDDTLAITTFGDPRAKAPWMVRKIVTFDVPSRNVATLVPRGFIDCTNAAYGLVGLEIGDLESRFAIASKAAPAVQQFALWNPATHTLAAAPADFKSSWNAAACIKPAPEDVGLHDLLGSKKPVRYLQPEHGVLAWGNLDDAGHPEGPSLRTPKKKVMLQVSINEISHDVRWLPFRRAYQLEAGVHDRAMDPPRDLPLVTMDIDGHVARQAIPAGLTRQLDAAGAAGPAEMIYTRAGSLVIQPGPASAGGGLYLVQGEQSRRVWCTATPAPGQSRSADGCAMTQSVALSPDGCHVAFDARPADAIANGFLGAPTIKVLRLCEPGKAVAEPGAERHHHKHAG